MKYSSFSSRSNGEQGANGEQATSGERGARQAGIISLCFAALGGLTLALLLSLVEPSAAQPDGATEPARFSARVGHAVRSLMEPGRSAPGAFPSNVTNPQDAENPAARIHPEFALSHDELVDLLQNAPDSIRKRIGNEAPAFLQAAKPLLDPQQAELLMLVDRDHPLPSAYRPADLVPMLDFDERITGAAPQARIDRRAATALAEMQEAARADGVELQPWWAYRSYREQEELHAHWRNEAGEEAAHRFSAAAGHSEHQLGTAIDFAPIGREFHGTPSDRWLSENAWRYGFSLSYPEGKEEITGYMHEGWHYRYLGRKAVELKREYFEGLQQHMLEFLYPALPHLRAAHEDSPNPYSPKAF